MLNRARSHAPSLRTRDLYKTAFLLSEGFRLGDFDRDEQGRLVFTVLGPQEAIAPLLREYDLGVAVVNVRRQEQELKRLKTLIHGGSIDGSRR